MSDSDTRRTPPLVASVGLRFELCYALSSLHAPPAWLPAPGPRTVAALRGLPDWPACWVGLADCFVGAEPEAGFDALLAQFDAMPQHDFARNWLAGLLHDAGLAGRLVGGAAALRPGIHGLPAKKREWLAHVDLYPFRPQAAGPLLLQRLIDDPGGVAGAVREVLTAYWEEAFAGFWAALRPAAEVRRRRIEDLVADVSPAAVFERLGLRAEWDGDSGKIRAARGGYAIDLTDIGAIHLLPSAVNSRRFWTVERGRPGGKSTAWFPCFDPALGPEVGPRTDAAAEPRADLDLVFRALGDGTRWAMAGLLAERPLSPSELADALGIARSTVSHHLFVLREAGLIEPVAAAGRGPLRLRREPFERLSMESLDRFFAAADAAA